jgi:hypothetical protein
VIRITLSKKVVLENEVALLDNKAKNSNVVNVVLLVCLLVGTFVILNFGSLKKNYQNRQALSNRNNIETAFNVQRRNEYFVMHFENDSKKLGDFFDISKPLIEALKYEYTSLDYEWPLHAYFFNSQKSYFEFLENVLKLDVKPGGGVYLTHYQAFFSYEQAGLSVWTHEILHPILDETYGELPFWADEGLAAYGEVYYIYKNEDVFMLDMGYHHPGRLYDEQHRLKNISLDQVLCCSDNTSEKRLVAMFLQKNNLLQSYLNVLKENKKESSKSKDNSIYKVFEKNEIELNVLWKAYLDSLNRELPNLFVKDLPHSLLK